LLRPQLILIMIFGCLQKVAMSVCGEYQINSIGMEDVKSTKGSQNQECLDQKEVSD
jgi:hypothetical protein